MARVSDIFENHPGKPATEDGIYSEYEVRLANRNAGVILETLAQDITPTGAHYLLTHFDVPMLDAARHEPVSYTHLTLPTTLPRCRSRGSP